MRKKSIWLTRTAMLGLAVIFIFALSASSSARVVEKVMKGAARLSIASLVQDDGEEIDKEMNTLAQENGAEAESATKVVVVFTVGGDKGIGAAQLTGSKDLVDKADRLIQVESELRDGNFRFKLYVPIEKGREKDGKRVTGLGLSGIVDISLTGENFSPSANRWDGKSALKAAAVAQIIERRADELDKHINRILSERNQPVEGPTRVVPFISVGDGVYTGAAQIAGSQPALDKVKAVLQLEKVLRAGAAKARVLIPSTDVRPRDIKRIAGVGVTAVIEIEPALKSFKQIRR